MIILWSGQPGTNWQPSAQNLSLTPFKYGLTPLLHTESCMVVLCRFISMQNASACFGFSFLVILKIEPRVLCTLGEWLRFKKKKNKVPLLFRLTRTFSAGQATTELLVSFLSFLLPPLRLWACATRSLYSVRFWLVGWLVLCVSLHYNLRRAEWFYYALLCS